MGRPIITSATVRRRHQAVRIASRSRQFPQCAPSPCGVDLCHAGNTFGQYVWVEWPETSHPAFEPQRASTRPARSFAGSSCPAISITTSRYINSPKYDHPCARRSDIQATLYRLESLCLANKFGQLERRLARVGTGHCRREHRTRRVVGHVRAGPATTPANLGQLATANRSDTPASLTSSSHRAFLSLAGF
jgi:hypothetical protein